MWGWLRGRWVGAGAGSRGGSEGESKEEGTAELDVVGLRWFGAGVVAGVVGAAVWLGLTCGLGNYWRWVFASASRRVPDWIVKSAYKLPDVVCMVLPERTGARLVATAT